MKNKVLRHLKEDSKKWKQLKKLAEKEYREDLSLMKSLKKKSKGQFLIVNLIVTFMVIFAFVVLYPIMKTRIDSAVSGMDVYSATMLQLTPFFIMLSLVLTIVFAALPVRE